MRSLPLRRVCVHFVCDANALETAKHVRHSTRTWLPAFDAAQRHLQKQKNVLDEDKDGGFALIESKHRLVKLQEAMPYWMYEPFFMELPDLQKMLFPKLSKLAGKLGKIYQEWDETGDGLRFYVMRHAWRSNAQRLFSPILNTIKTHKSHLYFALFIMALGTHLLVQNM